MALEKLIEFFTRSRQSKRDRAVPEISDEQKLNIERIARILADNPQTGGFHVTYRCVSRFRMNMFPDEQVPEIYAKAADILMERGDYDGAQEYLVNGGRWDDLLKIGSSFFFDDDPAQRQAGARFLMALGANDKQMPQSIALPLVQHVMFERDLSGGKVWPDSDAKYSCPKLLKACGAFEEAEVHARRQFEIGNYEIGAAFLDVSGRKLSASDLERYSAVLLQKRDIRGLCDMYKKADATLPIAMAKEAIETETMKPEWSASNVLEHLMTAKEKPSQDDFKDVADLLFRKRHFDLARRAYDRAGDRKSATEYWQKGEQILESEVDPDSAKPQWDQCQKARVAFAYLSKGASPAEAKARVAMYTAQLLAENPRSEVKALSNMEVVQWIHGTLLNMPIPAAKVDDLADVFARNEDYHAAARVYAAAGMVERAKELGDGLLAAGNKVGAKCAYAGAGDAEGKALAQFVMDNDNRIQYKRPGSSPGGLIVSV